MVDRIADNLNLPQISRRIFIEDIATKREIETATRIRKEQGKHVIPVPTFEVKKDFSGYFIDSIRIFGRRDREMEGEDIEKTVVRPTYSYLGKWMISNSVVRSMVSFIGEEIDGVYKIMRVSVNNSEGGLKIDMDVSMNYGVKVHEIAYKLKQHIKHEIEYMTAFNILEINIYVKSLNI